VDFRGKAVEDLCTIPSAVESEDCPVCPHWIRRPRLGFRHFSARLAPNQKYGDNLLWVKAFKRPNPETRRSTGENYVADCTKPDDVEPARRRLIQPAGWVGSIFQLIS
jgi:hypothetical protein